MRKMYKIINIAVIFMIIGVFIEVDATYSLDVLRAPLISNKSNRKFLKKDLRRVGHVAEKPEETIEITAQEAFPKIKYYKEDELSIARMIDRLGLGPEDIVLQVGAGSNAYHAIACAFRRSKVDIAQPDYWREGDKDSGISSQHDVLVERINDRRKFSIEAFGRDLIGDRIDTESYRGYIQDVNIPKKRYSYVFLFNILDSIVLELSEVYEKAAIDAGFHGSMANEGASLKATLDGEVIKNEIIEIVLSVCKDKATILISTYLMPEERKLAEEVKFFKNYAEKLGYAIEEGRLSEVQHIAGTDGYVRELIVTRNRRKIDIEQKLASNEKLIKETLKQLNSDLRKKKKELTFLFSDTLAPLKNGNITVERINALFKSQDKKIYEIIGQIHDTSIKKAIVENDIASYVGYQLNRDDLPDTGLCAVIRTCLKGAMLTIGLKSEKRDIFHSDMLLHSFLVVKGKEGLIGIDAAAGQFISKYKGHVAVSGLEKYAGDLYDGIMNWLSDRNMVLKGRRLERLKAEFEQNRGEMVLQILKSVKTTSRGL